MTKMSQDEGKIILLGSTLKNCFIKILIIFYSVGSHFISQKYSRRRERVIPVLIVSHPYLLTKSHHLINGGISKIHLVPDQEIFEIQQKLLFLH